MTVFVRFPNIGRCPGIDGGQNRDQGGLGMKFGDLVIPGIGKGDATLIMRPSHIVGQFGGVTKV
jgi:hypothetical protein